MNGYTVFSDVRKKNSLRLNTCVAVFLCIFVSSIIQTICYATFAYAASSSPDVTVLDLNQQIKDKKNKINSLKNQIDVYQKNISAHKAQAASLSNQMSVLEDSISQVSLNIQATQTQLDQLSLEMQQTNLSIQQSEADISIQKQRLASFVKQLYYNSDKNYLDILLSGQSFSDFFDTVGDLEKVHSDMSDTLMRINALHEQLLAQKNNLDQQEKTQKSLQDNLISEKDNFSNQKQVKQELIVQSTLAANKFQQMLNDARAQQADIGAQIIDLEKTAREKLKLEETGPFGFSWPVNPSRGISAYFHDPNYPFRYVFEHPAIDIRAYQGTPVHAAESGYVGRTYENGNAYAYVMLIHNKGFATVYGHLSRIIVKQDSYVTKGQIIGLSGGSPGTHGAGPFTTGPHLHFEVRINGVPVDPLKYLP